MKEGRHVRKVASACPCLEGEGRKEGRKEGRTDAVVFGVDGKDRQPEVQENLKEGEGVYRGRKEGMKEGRHQGRKEGRNK